MDLKFKFEVQNAVRSWLGYFMQENKVPATIMVDALSSSLLELKDMAYSELLSEIEEAAKKQEQKVNAEVE